MCVYVRLDFGLGGFFIKMWKISYRSIMILGKTAPFVNKLMTIKLKSLKSVATSGYNIMNLYAL